MYHKEPIYTWHYKLTEAVTSTAAVAVAASVETRILKKNSKYTQNNMYNIFQHERVRCRNCESTLARPKRIFIIHAEYGNQEVNVALLLLVSS